MSGHSKWSTIKHKKAANDKVKGSVFTKMAKGITIAVKKGGGIGDIDKNFSLRLAVEKARSVNMPKENIERAIAKGMGQGGDELTSLLIEGFGPEGVPVIIEAVTDNSNRSVQELRQLMEKYGGVMVQPGGAMYMFEKKVSEGSIRYTPLMRTSVQDKEKFATFIEMISEHDDVQEVYAAVE